MTRLLRLAVVTFMAGATLGCSCTTNITAKSRIAKAQADARALSSAVTKYADHMNRLPDELADLTTTARNTRGKVAGPFIDRLPTPQLNWSTYVYERLGDGTFRIETRGDGTTISIP